MMMMMASSSSSSSMVSFLTAAVIVHVAALCILLSWAGTASSASSSSSSGRCYKRIYSFGDSIADTGNTYYDDYYAQPPQSYTFLNLPYGETYFHHPTGRCSDGRLLIDFFAQHMGIPLLKPYLGIKNGKIQEEWNPVEEGVNFAVAGATALDPSFFLQHKGLLDIPTNYSLTVQLDWFFNFLPSICNSSSGGCKEVLGSSLFLVGEIGGNDFNYPLMQHMSVEEIRKDVPLVINQISSAIIKLIDVGAQTLVVPGNFPLGCNYIYLTMYESTNMNEYDQAGCLIWLNKFAQYYNKQLNAELSRLRALYPHTDIIYADYYNAALPIYQSPQQFGFKEPIQSACCTSGDQKGYSTNQCGMPGVIACDDPSQYISWDGLHLTEAAYKLVAQALLQGPFMDITISSCHSEI